jgi:hypothetical protein
MEEERVEENEVVQKSNFVKKKQDGIFVDEDERDDYPYIPEENNLLDDLLNENIVNCVLVRWKRNRRRRRSRILYRLNLFPPMLRGSTTGKRRRSIRNPNVLSVARVLCVGSTKVCGSDSRSRKRRRSNWGVVLAVRLSF